MSKRKTGGQVVVDTLLSLGITQVYGVVGGQTLAITDAILQTEGIEFIHTRHEGAAAVMADAYGRLTGRPAACIATTGPGATNLITGVGGSLRDSSPSFVLTCNNNGMNIQKDDAQNADHVELIKPLVKFSRLIAHHESIVQTIEEAYVACMSGNPGPVHLDFARDTIEGVMEDAPELPETHPVLSWVHDRPYPNQESLDKALEMIDAAQKPVLWVGNGANRADAMDEILEFAEARNIPVVTTFNGIGSVPTSHDLVFGPVTRMGTTLASDVLNSADLVVALGNSLNAVSTTRWSRELPQVIQVDIDPQMIGRYYSQVTFGVFSDLKNFLTEANLRNSSSAHLDSRARWVEELSKKKIAWNDSVAIADMNATIPVSPADIVKLADQVASDDTVLIADAGNPGVWSFLWETRPGRSYIKPVGFGNMGFALPSSIASALIDPARPCLALIGDGSLAMSLGDLETLARVGGNVTIVVFNDSSYGNIRQEQVLHFDGRTTGVDFNPVDFAQVANGMGVEGVRVDGLESLQAALSRAVQKDTPVLIDVEIDREVNAWTFEAFKK